MNETISYVGKGSIYVRLKGSSAGFLPIGNCDNLEISIANNKIQQMDYQSAGGAVISTVSRISTVTASINCLSIDGKNLALAMRATLSNVTTSAVTDELHDAYHGGFIKFDNQIDHGSPIELRIVSDDTILIAGSDYEVKNSGVLIAETPLTAGLTNGVAIEVDYQVADSTVVEPITTSQQTYEVKFDGLNEANSGSAVSVEFYKVTFDPTETLSLIGDDFASLPLTMDVLQDSSITGAGLSKFMKVQQTT